MFVVEKMEKIKTILLFLSLVFLILFSFRIYSAFFTSFPRFEPIRLGNWQELRSGNYTFDVCIPPLGTPGSEVSKYCGGYFKFNADLDEFVKRLNKTNNTSNLIAAAGYFISFLITFISSLTIKKEPVQVRRNG